jgi:hypothetical protein
VNVSHGCYSGPLRQFDGLRLIWSMTAGYGVLDCREVGGPIMPNLDYGAFTESDVRGEWPAGAPDDPLIILLAHAEHTGRIKRTHCSYLADRLEELEMRLMAGGVAGTVTPAWVLLTQQFVRGLRTAAAFNQDVVFS